MAVNDAFEKASDGLADGGDLIVDGSGSDTGSVQITELGATGECDIYRENDVNDDGTWASSVKIDNQAGNWHSQDNVLLASQAQNSRIRINNVSGGAVDAFMAGFEVNN